MAGSFTPEAVGEAWHSPEWGRGVAYVRKAGGTAGRDDGVRYRQAQTDGHKQMWTVLFRRTRCHARCREPSGDGGGVRKTSAPGAGTGSGKGPGRAGSAGRASGAGGASRAARKSGWYCTVDFDPPQPHLLRPVPRGG
ncbi:hypothetical protein GCM10023237_21480 [Streptomyces coeruleoprunus]